MLNVKYPSTYLIQINVIFLPLIKKLGNLTSGCLSELPKITQLVICVGFPPKP